MTTKEEHFANPGEWPADFPIDEHGRVEEGLVVWSMSGEVEGRTTGGRQRCSASIEACPGWFIDVTWETGQHLRPCSKGWAYDRSTRVVRIVDGIDDLSARMQDPVIVPDRAEWPPRSALSGRKGWRVTP